MTQDLVEQHVEQANRYEGSTDELVQQVKDRIARGEIVFTTGDVIEPGIWTPEKIEELKSVLRHIRDSEQRIKGGQG
ncbi:hypothetical protein AH06_278 [Erwinia phage AH06]|nr:hypothetical protein AH06_278 [Erwinia phage AH06]